MYHHVGGQNKAIATNIFDDPGFIMTMDLYLDWFSGVLVLELDLELDLHLELEV